MAETEESYKYIHCSILDKAIDPSLFGRWGMGYISMILQDIKDLSDYDHYFYPGPDLPISAAE